MRVQKLHHVVIGATAALFVGARLVPGNGTAEPVSAAASAIVHPTASASYVVAAVAPKAAPAANTVAGATRTAIGALAPSVKRLSADRALEDAFRSYFAFKAANPSQIKKPFLYFVDYGLPSTEPRGYVFDMEKLELVEGPFTVAHGRGSSGARDGVPTRFSNAHGSAATSLGLYLAQETYGFSGKASGRFYTSIGLRLKGLSEGFNDNARGRGVVAHGAPYVNAGRAGRSEGCPALEEFRARRLLPKLANGGMVFLFAPEQQWIERDQWVARRIVSDSTQITG